MNADLRKEEKNNFDKKFLRLVNNAIFRKIKENMRKHRDIRLAIATIRSNYLVSEQNYHTTNFFT